MKPINPLAQISLAFKKKVEAKVKGQDVFKHFMVGMWINKKIGK